MTQLGCVKIHTDKKPMVAILHGQERIRQKQPAQSLPSDQQRVDLTTEKPAPCSQPTSIQTSVVLMVQTALLEIRPKFSPTEVKTQVAVWKSLL